MSSPPTIDLTVERDLRGIRIDSFLAKHLRNYTSWRLARIVRAGGVRIDGGPVDSAYRVMAGQRITVQLIEPPDKLHPSVPIDVPIVYADPWLLVVDKPPGLIAHPTGEYQLEALTNVLQPWLDARTPVRGLLRAGIVHRLDRQTSGLMAVALTHGAHAALSTAFEQGRVAKTYHAIVEGRLTADAGVIDAAIGRMGHGRSILMSARADALERKAAVTRYRVLRRCADRTLVEAKPQTGRNHQIRVHFAHIGHPLIGDEFYLPHGAVRSPRSQVRAERSGLVDEPVMAGASPDVDDESERGRHALHAARLEFAHPVTDLWMTFESPLPADLRELLPQGEAAVPETPIASALR
ncbi:MAG: RluA family pseudouridine synthase [Planctomycetaceae bacterium]